MPLSMQPFSTPSTLLKPPLFEVGVGQGEARYVCQLCAAIACASFDVPLKDLMARTRRQKGVALARHVAVYLAHVVFQVPMGAVADGFGRERTSVGHAVRRVEDCRDEAAFDRRMERLETLARLCAAMPSQADG